MTEPLVWIDCEMTGLDPQVDVLVEVAVVVTDSEIVNESFLPVSPTRAVGCCTGAFASSCEPVSPFPLAQAAAPKASAPAISAVAGWRTTSPSFARGRLSLWYGSCWRPVQCAAPLPPPRRVAA